MTTLTPATAGPVFAPAPATAATTATTPPIPKRRRGLAFWIARYLPAEIVGTAAMVLAGFGVTAWTTNPVAIAAAALIGEIVGFYTVLAVTIYTEQSHVALGWRRAIGRTGLLLVAEFGPAELLDTLLIRPVAVLLGVWLLPDPILGLLAGKIVADIVFYALAAGAFAATDKAGLRDRRWGRATRP
ncbi:hypothetical protein GCM10022200_27840 [Microbacterium awajiense]|uniref:RDD family protein n=1 Tax=Microbacterium awajiense TaxID=415214 RepID=A0ABP7AWX3_9MICO